MNREEMIRMAVIEAAAELFPQTVRYHGIARALIEREYLEWHDFASSLMYEATMRHYSLLASSDQRAA
jgi:hypothetical protein